jgi:putative NIF3 family GTP cyclohydrolase 1 type 2
MKQLSRREFVALTVATGVAGRVASPFAGALYPSGVISVNDVIERIKKNVGVEWKAETVDTIKAGDPSTPVTGIVTTSMATLDVLQQAVKAEANLIITAAPTFYSRADNRTPNAGRGFGAGAAGGRGPVVARGVGPGAGGPSPATVFGPGTGASAAMPATPPLPPSIVPPTQPGAGLAAASATPPPPDPIYAGKNAFIDKNKLVIFRLNEHWNMRKPDPRAQGLAAAMGWTKYKAGDDGLHYDVPAMTLDALASQLKKALATRGGIRAIGDPATRIQKIGLLPGYTLIQASVAMLPNVDVIVAGEVQEWESATYAQDVVFAGVKKGFISIGRVVNEAPGMEVCAGWLKTIVSEVPVRFIPAGDPYWRPL